MFKPKSNLIKGLQLLILVVLSILPIRLGQAQDIGADGGAQGADPFFLIEVRGAGVTPLRNGYPTKGTKNYGCLKQQDADVTVEAIPFPNTQERRDAIEWAGGTQPKGSGNEVRTFSCSQTGKLDIHPSLDKKGDPMTLWVMWAEISYVTSGTYTFPPDNLQNKSIFNDRTITVGPFIPDADNVIAFALGLAFGRRLTIATLSPSGVHFVAPFGWRIYQETTLALFLDGVDETPEDRKGRWKSDTQGLPGGPEGDPDSYTDTLDSQDRIYDLDGPNMDSFGATQCAERYSNFRQWVVWQGSVASDTAPYAQWHWRSKWLAGSTEPNQIVLADVGVGNIALPQQSQGCP